MGPGPRAKGSRPAAAGAIARVVPTCMTLFALCVASLRSASRSRVGVFIARM